MRVGFTGTRKGMTEEQKRELWFMLRMIRPTELHHGASPVAKCADWQADKVARAMHINVVQHPPADASSKAMLARNDAIVEASDRLIAAPAGTHEVRRSGTWATVRRAIKAGVPVTIIWPDGRIMERVA